MNLKYHTQIYGVTQSGKTYAGLRLLKDQPGLRLFIDTKNETKYHKHFRYMYSISDIREIMEQKELFDGIICVEIDIEEKLSKQLDDAMKSIFMAQRENPETRVTVMIDEFQEYVSTRKVGKFIRAMFLQGLSKNIRMIITSQGFSLVPKNIRNNCEMTIIFKIRKQDIDAMMDLGLVQYEYSDSGYRIPLIDFDEPYKGYVEIGISGDLKRIS